MVTISPSRPALRYHGGKWLLAPWIIAQFPPHRVYVEPYGGGASVLIRKPRSYAEIYNDLDSEVVGYFRVLRDPVRAAQLGEAISLTAFAREEFEEAYQPSTDPIERARRLVVRSFMGFGSDGFNEKVRTGFRASSNRLGGLPAHNWTTLPEMIRAVGQRFRGVIIENRKAIDVMLRHDAADTLHYVDPPYVPDTRSPKSRRGKVRYHAYRHELTESDHRHLADVLHRLDGMVILSGYHSPLYDDLFGDWTREEREALADGARKRVEVLWFNPAASAAREAERAGFALGGLF